MRPSLRATVTVSILLVTCMAGSVLLLLRLDRLRGQSTAEEILYIPSPKVLKRLSLGYDGLLADIYWTRVVQYFGSKHVEGAMRYDLLAPLLEITTELDPHLVIAYQFGSNFLAAKPPNGAGMPERAVQLEEYGIRNNPDEWRLYYELGFIRYMELKDYAGAADAFARGAQAPNAHPWMKLLAARMAQQAGELETARMMWITTYNTTVDKSIRANAVAHLNAIQVDETSRSWKTWWRLTNRNSDRRLGPAQPRRCGHVKERPGRSYRSPIPADRGWTRRGSSTRRPAFHRERRAARLCATIGSEVPAHRIMPPSFSAIRYFSQAWMKRAIVRA